MLLNHVKMQKNSKSHKSQEGKGSTIKLSQRVQSASIDLFNSKYENKYENMIKHRELFESLVGGVGSRINFKLNGPVNGPSVFF